jgi:hypothetical protein
VEPPGVHLQAVLRRIHTSSLAPGVTITVINIFAETTRCRRHPIGGLRPPMPILMTSMQLSLLPNSYGEIQRTSVTIVPR